MNREQFLTLLTKKIEKQLSENESKMFNDAINANEEYNQIHTILMEYQNNDSLTPDVTEKLRNVWNKIKNEEENPASTLPRIFPYKAILKIAATFLVFVGIGYFLLYNKQDANVSAERMIKVQTSNQKLFTTLDDGTKIILNKYSVLNYNEDFGKNKRHIILQGEAYFDVTKNEKMRLIVETGNIYVQVKGTAFTVSNYNNQKDVQVALFNGTIEVSNKNSASNNVMLKPNQKVVIAGGNQNELAFNITEITQDDLPKSLLSLDSLVFRKERLEHLVIQLEKKYNVKIEILNERLKSKRFSGMFTKETLREALEALRLSYPFSYKETGNKIIIE